MLEEILELLGSKWGLYGLGAMLVLAGPGKKVLRGAAKELLKAGLNVSDSAREIVAEIKEQGSDLLAEVQAERNEALEKEPEAKTSPKAEARSEKKSKKAAD